MPRFDAKGAALYYEVAGQGPPLVLLHGFGCGLRSWDPQVASFSASHRVVTYDARGHGGSDAPDDPDLYSPEIAVADLLALLDHLGLGRVALGGLSMGGNVALHFALACPERLCALIVADTGSGSEGGDSWFAGVTASAAALEREGLERYAERALGNPAFASYARQSAAAERFLRSCLMTNRARGLAHTARGVVLRRPSVYSLGERLRALALPTLLIVGEHDEDCADVHRFMASAIPGARHVVIPGAGHLSNLEAPEAFDRAVRNFLEATARGPTR